MAQSQSFLDSDDDEMYLSIIDQIDNQTIAKYITPIAQPTAPTHSPLMPITPIAPVASAASLTSVMPTTKPTVTPNKPMRKKKLMIHADIIEPNSIYFTHSTETENIYKIHSGTQILIDSRPFWKIPLQNYRRVIASLKSFVNPFDATIDHPPDSVFQAMINFRPKKVSPTMLTGNLTDRLNNALYPHQRESIIFAASRNFRVFLADDMGLGKTIEAVSIACAAGFPKNLHVVVLAPNHLVSNWVDAFLKWTNICQSNINVLIRNENITSTPLTIVSYNVAVRKSDKITAMDYGLVIADECHEFKNGKTQTYQKVAPIMNKSKYLVLLSGTPMTKPSELFPQIKLLLPTVFVSFKEFGTRYCRGELNQQGYFTATGCTHSDELRTVLEQLVLLRREKDEILTDLPVKKRFHVMLDYFPSPEMKEQIEQMRVRRIAIAAGMETLKMEQNTIMTTAFALTGSDKLPAVLAWFCGHEFRKAFFTDARKCLVFAYHRVVLNGVTKWMEEREVGCISVSGSTPKEQRDGLFRQFMTDPNCRVAVLSIEVAATGVTLTAASMVVFAELKWTPADHMQAEDRVHRIGQNRDVEIYYLHAEGSLDDRIWEILERKLVVISSVISSKTKTFETDFNA